MTGQDACPAPQAAGLPSTHQCDIMPPVMETVRDMNSIIEPVVGKTLCAALRDGAKPRAEAAERRRLA